MALRDTDGYPIDRGEPHVTHRGLVPGRGIPTHVVKHQVPHSTALHARMYLGGARPLRARLRDRLSPAAAGAARASGLGGGCHNPFRSVVVRAVEVVYAVEVALRIITAYERPEPAVEVTARAGTGHGITEAPRGLLYHRCELDESGLVTAVDIVPPTSQDQSAIEDDVAHLVAGHPDLDDHAQVSLVRAGHPAGPPAGGGRRPGAPGRCCRPARPSNTRVERSSESRA
jgi:sulfhydrogenase subunit alpha